MSKIEKKAINSLSSDQNIVIKTADKGGTIVILNKADYIAEVSRQLSGKSFYIPVAFDPTRHVQSLVRIVLQEALSLGQIDVNVFNFLQVSFPSVPLFYTFPTIHEGLAPPPGHPIVSGCRGVLEHLAQYKDHFLQPFVLKIPHLNNNKVT